MRWLLQIAILACLGLLSTGVGASLPALRIQPLGDSVTKGSLSSHNNGYRGYLRNLLTKRSENGVDMIGSLRNGGMSDNDHEGHSGHFLAEIAEFYKLSIRARPNVVLIHAGTNNMDKERDLAKSPDLMESIIDGVNKEAPDATILVMPVIWANDTRMQNNTDHFNGALDRIIKAKQDDGVHILNVPTNLTLADMADFKHPNDRGYEKMAEAWLSAILEADDNGWLEEPVAVDASKLQNIGLGTRTGESEGGGSNDESDDGADDGNADEDAGEDGEEDEKGDESEDGDEVEDEGRDDDEDSAASHSSQMLVFGITFGLLATIILDTLR